MGSSPTNKDRRIHDLYPTLARGGSPLAGEFSAAFGLPHHSGRNDIIKQADKKPSPLGARRGDVKHRKNSPQVTVFSQSGEVAMLRAGQAIATWQSPGREDGQIEHGLTQIFARASQMLAVAHRRTRIPKTLARACFAPVSRRGDRFRFREILTLRLRLRSE